jgi:hypothetical protein
MRLQQGHQTKSSKQHMKKFHGTLGQGAHGRGRAHTK